MIIASTHRRELEAVLVKMPRWKCENIGYIDPAEPLKMIYGRQHYLIQWKNPSYIDEYVDCSYLQKMEDISKSKRIQYSPGEVWVSPEQCELAAVRRQEALKGLRKSRVSHRRLLEESSSPRQRIVEEDDTLELSIDPFAEVSLEERLQAAQKRSPKPLPEERLQAAQQRSPKPPLEERLQAAQKRSPKPLPEERLQVAQKRSPKPPPEERLQAAQKRSPKPAPLKCTPPQVGEEDVQASKPLPEGRKKSPALQEKSKQSSQRRWVIMEEDDKMFPCNIDPFSEELVYQFEAQDENKAAESDQSLQENCF